MSDHESDDFRISLIEGGCIIEVPDGIGGWREVQRLPRPFATAREVRSALGLNEPDEYFFTPIVEQVGVARLTHETLREVRRSIGDAIGQPVAISTLTGRVSKDPDAPLWDLIRADGQSPKPWFMQTLVRHEFIDGVGQTAAAGFVAQRLIERATVLLEGRT